MQDDSSKKMNAATLSVVSNSALVTGKVSIGLLTGSVAILSEGIHSGIDLVAALIAFFSVRESGKPADERHRYGHGKIENISGTVEALLIIVAALWIIYEAADKLRHGAEVGQLGLGLGIMGISAVVNIFVSSKLMHTAKATDSVALEADAMHLRTDVFTSLGVLVGLAAIKLTGISLLDPIAAIGVALLIIKAGVDLTRQAFFPLVDVSLPAEEEQVIVDIIESFSANYLEFHKLRTRKAGPERHIDLHLVVPQELPVRQVHSLCDLIEAEIKRKFPGSHVLIHSEPCEPGQCKDCSPAHQQCPNKSQ